MLISAIRASPETWVAGIPTGGRSKLTVHLAPKILDRACEVAIVRRDARKPLGVFADKVDISGITAKRHDARRISRGRLNAGTAKGNSPGTCSDHHCLLSKSTMWKRCNGNGKGRLRLVTGANPPSTSAVCTDAAFWK